VELASLLPFVLVLVVFWLLVIRPASRRQRQLRDLQGAVAPGDPVMLTAGIYGTVQSVGEDRVRVQIADGVVIEVTRAAIGSREDPAGAGQAPPDETPPTQGGI
jgi:preprotein translocase subunit YajC